MEARRRAAKKKTLKKMGKSKSTDTEEEQEEEDVGDDGKRLRFFYGSFNFFFSFIQSSFRMLIVSRIDVSFRL